MDVTTKQLEEVSAALSKARSVAVLTGAGISAESGIRTFRDTMEGLWKEFDPQKLATPEAFAADPALVSRWYDSRRQGCRAADPNPGHTGLADIERHLTSRGGRFTLLTQNVDGLHQKAGSRNVVELHGSVHIWRCTNTGKEVRPGPEPFQQFPVPSPWGGTLRPGVVWFGEMLPPAAVEAAQDAANSCDLFFSVGTSAVVYPAAGFVAVAHRRGAVTVEINRDPTPISSHVTHSIRGKAGEILPQLVQRAFK